MDREIYERDLKRRQYEHLKNVKRNVREWQPCAHNSCSECHGTGVKANGSACIHMLHCSCPKCSPCMLSMGTQLKQVEEDFNNYSNYISRRGPNETTLRHQGTPATFSSILER
jgi:hypothetical protein